MLFCSKCKAPLSDFDVCFSEKIYFNRLDKGCECFKCITSNGHARKNLADHVRDEKSIKPHIVTTIFLLLCIVDIIFMYAIGERSFGFPADMLIALFMVGFLALGVFGSIICGAIVTAGFGMEPGNPFAGTGSYYYSTTIERDGRIRTEKVEETAGLIALLPLVLNIFLAVTFFIWCIPHLLYVLSRKKRRYAENKELIDAYTYASSLFPKVNIPIGAYYDYETIEKQYEKERNKISNRYFYMETNSLSNKMNQSTRNFRYTERHIL